MFGRNQTPPSRNGMKSLRRRIAERSGIAGIIGLIALPFAFFLACVAAWLTHVVVCLAAGKWGFLIAGAIAFPIAIIHGLMIWFGFGR